IGGTIPTSHTYEFQSNSPYINQVRVNMLDLDIQFENRWARATVRSCQISGFFCLVEIIHL
ncbi:MAG: hypothetical protein WCK84_13750, partial [Bacteroidota bacterium]